MNLQTLKYFKKTAELEHLTQAADELFIAQPALSRMIASLEEELGVPLFDRVKKRIYLNDYGKIVLRHTNRILRELDDIETEIADMQERGEKTVRVAMHAATQNLTRLLVGFKTAHPDIRLEVMQYPAAADEEDAFDLRIFASVAEIDDDRHIRLLEETIYLALPAGHPLSEEEAIDLRGKQDLEFICLPKGRAMRTLTDNYCRMAGFEPKIHIECNIPDTVRRLVHAGMGVSFIPELTWKHATGKKMVLKPLSFPEGKRYIYLAKRDGYQSQAAQLFQSFVIGFFADLAYGS